MKRNVYVLFLLVCFISLKSQEVSFLLNVQKQTILEDEQFQIEFSLNEHPQKFIQPEFKNFSVLMGPSQGSSISTRIINGKYSTEKKITYTYILRPKTKGKLEIEPATAYINGKYYKTQPTIIEVLEEKNAPKDLNSPTSIAKRNVHLAVEVSRKNTYIGEQIIATYKLYFNANVNNPSSVSEPSLDGFISNEIKLDDRRQSKKVNYKGIAYNEFILKQLVLTPNKTGKLKIGAMKIEIEVMIPTGRYTFFGDAITNNENIVVKSEPLEINVNPLPINAPSSFNGAVGEFDFKANLTRDKVKANESVELKLTLSGNGNLDITKFPEFLIPKELEKYDPKEIFDIKKSENGIQGTKSQTYLIIPRYQGEYKIPSVEFSYFSPKTKTYKTIKTKDIIIEVEGGIAKTENNITYTTEKEKVEYIGKSNEISYIKTKTKLKDIDNKSIINPLSGVFYGMYFSPYIMILMFLGYMKKKASDNKNIKSIKQKKAKSIIIKTLSLSKKMLDEGKSREFYLELEIALNKFLADRLQISKSNLNKDKIKELLSKKKVEENIINDFISLLDECEMAKYSPILNIEHDKDIYNKTIQIIEGITKK